MLSLVLALVWLMLSFISFRVSLNPILDPFYLEIKVNIVFIHFNPFHHNLHWKYIT